MARCRLNTGSSRWLRPRRQAERAADRLNDLWLARQSGRGQGPEALVRDGVAKHQGIQGGGGTHMLEGVKRAIDQPIDAERVRIVSMLSDGYHLLEEALRQTTYPVYVLDSEGRIVLFNAACERLASMTI